MTPEDVRARLPNLVVIGVPKAGTGSLFTYLAQHPSICPSATKEVGFFTPLRLGQDRLPPIETYARQFAACGDEPLRVEATPSYCFGGKGVRAAMREVLDRPRLVLLLREPVDRLWSAYTFQRSLGNVSEPFDAYVERCDREQPAGDIIGPGHYNGVAIGVYAAYVPAWLDAFGEDLRVVFFDDLTADPRSVLADLCRWLAIDAEPVGAFDLAARNPTVHPRSPAIARTFAAARRAAAVLPEVSRVRSAVRGAYFRINRGSPAPAGMTPEMRAHLGARYAESNAVVADALRRAGYAPLPRWLGDGGDARASAQSA